MGETQYLPLLEQDGSLINRPRLMLFFASVLPDLHSILMAYHLALIEDSLEMSPHIKQDAEGCNKLSIPSQILIDHINEPGRHKTRLSAGHTVLEWLRDEMVHGRVAGLDKTRERVAALEHQHSIKSGKTRGGPTQSTVRTLKRAFSEFRPIAHFVALRCIHVDMYVNAEKAFSDLEVAGMAKTLELFLDRVMSSKGKGWDPIRVPPEIPAVPLPEFDEEELQKLLQPQSELHGQ